MASVRFINLQPFALSLMYIYVCLLLLFILLIFVKGRLDQHSIGMPCPEFLKCIMLVKLNLLFQVPVAKFQELRYNVALILKEMNDLEKRSILKIQD